MKFILLFCCLIAMICSFIPPATLDGRHCFNENCTLLGFVPKWNIVGDGLVADCSGYGSGAMFTHLLDCHQYRIEKLADEIQALRSQLVK